MIFPTFALWQLAAKYSNGDRDWPDFHLWQSLDDTGGGDYGQHPRNCSDLKWRSYSRCLHCGNLLQNIQMGIVTRHISISGQKRTLRVGVIMISTIDLVLT